MKIKMYLLPVSDVGKGTRTSTATRSNRPSTGIGCNGAVGKLRSDFLVAQSTQDEHHRLVSVYIPAE